MLRKLTHGFLWLVYWALAAAGTLYFLFWADFRTHQQALESTEALNRRLKPPRHVSPETMRLVGSLRPGKESHFVHFDQAKTPGTIRVCALGDSMTNGNEVGPRHDYPSYLQREFEQQGYDDVQVLNFANGWHGFSQQYVVWKRIAHRFDCDFVLLLPMTFWALRDTTFNHTNGEFPGYLHARLILEEDELRLLEPIGKTGPERRDAYLRAIPHWRYLRYDRRPSSIVDAMLPHGFSIRNPFYYDPRPAGKEVLDIYRRIVQSIAEDGPQVVVLFRGRQQKLYPQLIPGQPRGVGAAVMKWSGDFPYLTPAGHPSSWGQELTARVFFRLLTDGPLGSFTLVTVRDRLKDQGGETRPLHSFEKIWLDYEGERVGFFVPEGSRKQDSPNLYMGTLRSGGTAALLALVGSNDSISNACLLPLHEMPKTGGNLVLTPAGAVREKVVVGKLHQPRPGIAIFKVVLPNVRIPGCGDLRSAAGSTPVPGDGRLSLDGRAIAEIKDRTVRPFSGKVLLLREAGEYLARVDALQTPAELQLVLQSEDGAILRAPFLALETEQAEVLVQKRAPARRIAQIGGETRIVTSIPTQNGRAATVP